VRRLLNRALIIEETLKVRNKLNINWINNAILATENR